MHSVNHAYIILDVSFLTLHHTCTVIRSILHHTVNVNAMVVHFIYVLVRGMAWYSMVLHGIERYSVVLHGISYVVLCSIAW